MARVRKLRIRGYGGEKRPIKTYRDWVDEYGNVTVPPKHEWDGCQPWSQAPVSALEDDYIEALEGLTPKLKGRQKQIVELLREGVLNQAEMARRLGIARENVVIHLRRIAKKILKSVSGSVF
ncbi:hypothetical protein LCGC14_1422900 [marine sediment metagenome]|uniref:HTH luxR-type domain-containing protein n=1 Tax=marine sediment metagenome TaxID=412755 RepID=A0A0F9JRB2_9ZZZZ